MHSKGPGASSATAHCAVHGPVIAFAVDDDVAEVLIYAITYGGADWAMHSTMRSR